VVLVTTQACATPFVEIPINPIEDITPGEFCDDQDKDFKEFRYAEKMPYCKRNVSKGMKSRVYEKYHIPAKCKHRYTVDHFIPLALGGNNAEENLWPEHILVKETRQELEQELYNSVSKGLMKYEEAVLILMEEKMKLKLDLSHVDGCG